MKVIRGSLSRGFFEGAKGGEGGGAKYGYSLRQLFPAKTLLEAMSGLIWTRFSPGFRGKAKERD